MSRIPQLLGMLLIAWSLQAASLTSFRMVPAEPTNTTPITLDLKGLGADPSDTPASPKVTRDGTQIRVEFGQDRTDCCISVASSWQQSVPIGVLPAGDYEIVVTLPGPINAVPFRHSFVVRDVTTIPFALPGNPGAVTSIAWDGYHEIERISFGDEEVSFRNGNRSIWVDVFTPELPGLRDVTVEWEDGRTVVAKNAFELSNGVPAILDRYLIPVYLNADGAGGSRWETSLTMLSRGVPAATFPRIFERDPRSLEVKAVSDDRPRGFVLGLPYREASEYELILRVRDAARQTGWTRLPIVRLNDFYRTSFAIEDIPVARGSRILLRIYATGTAWTRLRVGSRLVDVVRAPGDELAYAQVDLTNDWSAGPGRVLIDSQPNAFLWDWLDAPTWAFVTVTNSETGAVTVVTPSLAGPLD